LSVIANRYAAALADVAVERKSADAFRRDLASFAEAYASSADLREFLHTPAVSREPKHEVIDKLAARLGLNEGIRNFIYILADNRRLAALPEITAAFEAELNTREGIAEAAVTSARELSAAEKKEIVAALERKTGKRIEAQFALNAALLGGAVVQIGSTIYDGSIREQLNRLRAQLEAESFRI
jgi:F-type H+-transporting ATPase subunit delta